MDDLIAEQAAIRRLHKKVHDLATSIQDVPELILVRWLCWKLEERLSLPGMPLDGPRELPRINMDIDNTDPITDPLPPGTCPECGTVALIRHEKEWYESHGSFGLGERFCDVWWECPNCKAKFGEDELEGLYGPV